jgi:hypothetical protein
MELLVRIKRAVLSGHVNFTRKATEERRNDDLTEEDVRESIINATAIYKSIKSTSVGRGHSREMLHIIYGTTYNGVVIYTKGKLVVERGVETFYVLVSSKRSE